MCLPEGMETQAILRGSLNCKKPMSLGNRSNRFKEREDDGMDFLQLVTDRPIEQEKRRRFMMVVKL